MDTKKIFSCVEEAIEDFRQGKFVIVVDDEDRENEGDFITPAEMITPEKVNFMLREGRGVLCAPITISRAKELGLQHQVDNNTSMLGTPFTVTVDKLEGCTTGVSAADRAATIQALADPASKPETFGRPGHINPLYAQDNGVIRRAGHTEAAVDLARLAGLQPAAALIEILNPDGTCSLTTLSSRSNLISCFPRQITSIPQPISTPTVFGTIRSLMAMTVPIVQPMPAWASGIIRIMLSL